MKNRYHQHQLSLSSEIYEVIEGRPGSGSIYISNYYTALQGPFLSKLGIGSVLTVGKGCFLVFSHQQISDYLYIPIEDQASTNLIPFLDRCLEFIEKSRTQTNVLVHCRTGKGVSAAVIIAYLTYRFSYCFDTGFQILKRANPKININCGFVSQLRKWLEQVRNETDYEEEKGKDQATKRTNQSTDRNNNKRSEARTMLRSLHKTSKQIESRITNIRKSVEKEKDRKRSNSQYLKQKLKQLQKDKRRERLNSLFCIQENPRTKK